MHRRILAGKSDLAESLAGAAKPPEQWRVGIEHEKCAYRLEDGRPAPFTGATGSLQALLKRLVDAGWTPVREGSVLVGAELGGAAVSLEPGGQLELAGTPAGDLTAVADELRRHDDWQPGSRHDAPHLLHPGELRFRRRGGHGAQAPGRPGTAAGELPGADLLECDRVYAESGDRGALVAVAGGDFRQLMRTARHGRYGHPA